MARFRNSIWLVRKLLASNLSFACYSLCVHPSVLRCTSVFLTANLSVCLSLFASVSVCLCLSQSVCFCMFLSVCISSPVLCLLLCFYLASLKLFSIINEISGLNIISKYWTVRLRDTLSNLSSSGIWSGVGNL